MCFCGLHEVARELEDPFVNMPNDLPANNLHSQFNEGLLTMYKGYHPDAYWEVKEIELDPSDNEGDSDGDGDVVVDVIVTQPKKEEDDNKETENDTDEVKEKTSTEQAEDISGEQPLVDVLAQNVFTDSFTLRNESETSNTVHPLLR